MIVAINVTRGALGVARGDFCFNAWPFSPSVGLGGHDDDTVGGLLLLLYPCGGSRKNITIVPRLRLVNAVYMDGTKGLGSLASVCFPMKRQDTEGEQRVKSH